MKDIHEDEVQLRLIGLTKGLEDYTTKNPPIQALTEGLLGKLRAYLKTAAENKEIDYLRQQETEGNIALTDALHAEDLRYPDREEEDEQSDEEMLSREKEKYCPSGDPVAEAVERKETLREWRKELTENERTAATLMASFENQQKVAEVMGISQQRVSELLLQALKKLQKITADPL